MSITILLEIGHDASLRTKTTPEGFTHDWEVFVKGFNGADIHYYVEKVVFHLHETFPKPKRVVKEPPYSLKTSGYAGFTLPIEIYLRNNQEPKKIRFNYDLMLQPPGPPIHKIQKEKYTFFNPSEEFKSKLLKGGAVHGSGGSQDIDSTKIVDEKNQMTSKPKLSGTDGAKKHKLRPEEPRTTDFENLFGPPIKKTSKAPEPPPKPKEVPKSSSSSDKDKDKSDKSKIKPPHKEKDREKSRDKSSESGEKKKDEKRRSKDDKSKDRDRGKEKSSKKDKEKEKERSPQPPPRPRSPSPKRSPKKAPSPTPQHRHSSSKEQIKEERKEKDKDKDRNKEEKKSKKDKREHKDSKHRDRDKEKDHKEHKSRESKSSKDKEKEASNAKAKDISPTPPPIPVPQQIHKTDKKVKEKEQPKDPLPPKEEEKPEKVRQDPPEDRQKQHKHKKKDKKEKREEKHSRSEKKIEKQPSSTPIIKEVIKEPPVSVSSSRDVDKSHLFGSPKSDSPSTPKEPEPKSEDSHVFPKDDESSNDSMKISSREASPVPKAPSKSPSPVIQEPIRKLEPEKKREESPKKKEKKERKKDKKSDKDNEKKRKRKSDSSTNVEPEQPPEKIMREEENNNSDDESKVSSTEDANPIIVPKSECDMDMLRDLQHKIMNLKDNADLQKVVQLIAKTGPYEVSAHTFDFDLCLLDTSTVRQLQEFFSTVS
ncbi:hypothetical protein JTB14_017650 [Gonioctena quinquepunctata]|nr:hypothetical protein JTB14_017650 [Gonioctena quinquepunctata]